MEQKMQKTQTPLSTTMPIRVDMIVGDESARTRIAKVKHQGFEETVRVLNGVLRKMNAGVKLEIVEDLTPKTAEEESNDEISDLDRFTSDENFIQGLTAHDS